MQLEFERGRLIVYDYDTIHELSVFVEKNGKYRADDGEHDDLVMSMSLLMYIISQKHLFEQYISETSSYMKDVYDIDDGLFFSIDDGLTQNDSYNEFNTELTKRIKKDGTDDGDDDTWV